MRNLWSVSNLNLFLYWGISLLQGDVYIISVKLKDGEDWFLMKICRVGKNSSVNYRFLVLFMLNFLPLLYAVSFQNVCNHGSPLLPLLCSFKKVCIFTISPNLCSTIIIPKLFRHVTRCFTLCPSWLQCVLWILYSPSPLSLLCVLKKLTVFFWFEVLFASIFS